MKNLFLLFALLVCFAASCTKPSDNNAEDPDPAQSKHPYPVIIGSWELVVKITDIGPSPEGNTEKLFGKATLKFNEDFTYKYIYTDDINSSYNKDISSEYKIGEEYPGTGYFSVSMKGGPGALSLNVSNDTLRIFNGVGSNIYRKVK